MELCRICLRGRGKMFPLQSEPLKTCFEAIASSLDEEIGLPQSVCYICSRQLKKCYSLIRRTQIAKTTLQNICLKYGGTDFNALKKSNETAIMRSINKAKSNLSTKLKTIKLSEISLNGDIKSKLENTLNGSYKITHSSNISGSESNDIDYICDDDYKIEAVYTRDQMINSEDIKEDLEEQIETDDFIDKNDSKKTSILIEIDSPIDDVDEDLDDIPLSAIKTECDMEENSFHEPEEIVKQRNLKQRVVRKKRKKVVLNSEGLTKEEADLKQYFDIKVLSIEEQIAERLKMKETNTYRDALYRCEICYRTYLNPQAHQTHLQAHTESHGDWECPVCKVRFRAESTMLSHADKSHGKKYCCKTCPKTFTKLELAAKHSKRHTGYVYKCSMCDHTAANKFVLKNHLRNTHSVGGSACSICGQTFANIRGLKLHMVRQHNVRLSSDEQKESFDCRECELSFPTVDALATHNQTHHCHNDNSILICSTCGEEFPSQNELNKHSKLIHGDEIKWGLPGDTYPTKCEHCGAQVNNRKEHYFHVRKIHPKEREKYQAVITAVCITCGKGFQNATKLHLHELRHKGVLSIRCPHAHCPRLFYDKFHLARHVAVHSDDRPFACAHCDKTFKLRSNLDRHAKVHSDVTAYECSLCNKRFRYSSSRNLHIKTVHYKMPLPPRKRKTAKSNKALNSFDECL